MCSTGRAQNFCPLKSDFVVVFLIIIIVLFCGVFIFGQDLYSDGFILKSGPTSFNNESRLKFDLDA